MARTKKSQAAHDQTVAREARRLKREGWDVEADIHGFDQPSGIGQDGRVPDIVARKAGAKRIIEVETPHTDAAHKDQQSTFRRSAGQQKRTTFEKIVTEDD